MKEIKRKNLILDSSWNSMAKLAVLHETKYILKEKLNSLNSPWTNIFLSIKHDRANRKKKKKNQSIAFMKIPFGLMNK